MEGLAQPATLACQFTGLEGISIKVHVRLVRRKVLGKGMGL